MTIGTRLSFWACAYFCFSQRSLFRSCHFIIAFFSSFFTIQQSGDGSSAFLSSSINWLRSFRFSCQLIDAIQRCHRYFSGCWSILSATTPAEASSVFVSLSFVVFRTVVVSPVPISTLVHPSLPTFIPLTATSASVPFSLAQSPARQSFQEPAVKAHQSAAPEFVAGNTAPQGSMIAFWSKQLALRDSNFLKLTKSSLLARIMSWNLYQLCQPPHS